MRNTKLLVITLLLITLLGTSVGVGAYTVKGNGTYFSFKPNTSYSSNGGNTGSTNWSSSKSGTTWVFRPKTTPTPAPTPEPKPQPEPKPEPPTNPSLLTAKEQQLLDLVNRERKLQGLPVLQVDYKLVEIARLKSKDLIANNYFAHTSPTYGTVANMLRSFGVFYKYAGENLAGAYSVTSAHNNLMASAGHRQNILMPLYTHVGIGIVEGGPYGMMVTQLFVGR
ncbi:MAG: CAP domain-containing protein [Limnochordia bacterium]|nr:CAP domain-containing protein [Limnochordia bacterium]MDD2630588.1 CAP domain-containing protein [Limnochordia bacterium]MDD4518100.1 CAP domain-containing protein [Limnochordia bacterium]